MDLLALRFYIVIRTSLKQLYFYKLCTFHSAIIFLQIMYISLSNFALLQSLKKWLKFCLQRRVKHRGTRGKRLNLSLRRKWKLKGGRKLFVPDEINPVHASACLYYFKQIFLTHTMHSKRQEQFIYKCNSNWYVLFTVHFKQSIRDRFL